VAVLYFENLSRDTSDQYLADGITEEITTSLGRVGRLTVVSPAAVRRAQRAGDDDPVRLARALGVRHLVEGSVRRAGPQARITVRLLGADARTTVWTDAYTRPTADLLALEEEIAQQVASGVVGTLLPDERRSLAAARVDPEAHDHVMRGNFQLARRSEASIRRAIAEYDAAVAIDSGYALAWGRLALGHALLRYWAGLGEARTAPAESIQVRGEHAAARALALDFAIADGWAALGYLRLYRDPIGMRGVLTAFWRAVALAPNSGEAHHQLGTGYLWFADTARARTELLRALELEPGRIVTFDNLSDVALVGRRPAEILRWTDSAIAVDRSHNYSYPQRAIAFAMLGDTAATLQALEAVDRVGAGPQMAHPRCVALGVLRAAAARVECQRVLDGARTPMDSVTAFLGLGDAERALTALESVAAEGRTLFLWLRMAEPQFDPLRSSPRFQRLVATLRPAEGAEP
jgi:TolB-like protein